MTLELSEHDVHDLGIFTDGSFDAGTCSFALMFSPEPVRVLREVKRVLAPGGRAALCVWDEPARNACFTTMFSAPREVTPIPAPLPDAPGPFALAAPGALQRVLSEAGFRSIEVESAAAPFEFESLAEHFEMSCDMAAPVQRAVSAMSVADVDRFSARLAAALAPYRLAADRLRVPATPVCATGTV